MLFHRRASALFLALAAVGCLSGGSGGVASASSTLTPPAGSSTGGNSQRPPPPPPPSSGGGPNTSASAGSSSNAKQGEKGYMKSSTGGGDGNTVKMPPPPPPPPPPLTSTRTQMQAQRRTASQRIPPPPPPMRQQTNQFRSYTGSASTKTAGGDFAATQSRPSSSTSTSTTSKKTSSANLNAAVTMAGLGQEEREEMFLGQLQREAKGSAGAGTGTVASPSPSAGEDEDDAPSDKSGQNEHVMNQRGWGAHQASSEQSESDTRPADDVSADRNGSQEGALQGQGQYEQGQQQSPQEGYGGYDQQQHYDMHQQQTGWAQRSPPQSDQQYQHQQQQQAVAWQQQEAQQKGYQYHHHQQQQQQQQQPHQQNQYYEQQGAQAPSNTENDASSGRMMPYQRQYAQQQHYMQQQQTYQRMQHQQHRPPQGHNHPQQNQTPTMFKGILNRLEKGMDAVANLEDMVDKRARAFGRTVKYATAGKMSVKEAVAASVAGSRDGLKKIRQKERIARQAPNMFDLFKDDIEAAEAQVEEAEALAAAVDGNVGGSIGGADGSGGRGEAAPWDRPSSAGQNHMMATSLLSNGGATTGDGIPPPLALETKSAGEAQNVAPQQPSSPLEQLLGQPSAAPRTTTTASSSTPDRRERAPIKQSIDDDDGDWSVDSTKRGRLSRAFGFLPNPASFIPSFGRRDSLLDLNDWSDDDDDWDTAATKRPLSTSARQSAKGMMKSQASVGGVPAPVNQLLGRGDSRTGESGFNLVSRQEGYRCHRLGRTRSLFDIAALVFLVVAINELSPFISRAITEASTTILRVREGEIPIVGNIQSGRKLFLALSRSLSSAYEDSWAPLALAATILSIWSNDVFVRPAVRRTASAVSSNVRDQASSGQMFLRLVAGLPPRKVVPDVLAQSARRQVWSDVEASRLRSFSGLSTIALVALTVSVAKPILGAIFDAGVDIVSLDAWTWPLEWSVLGQGMKSHLGTLGSIIGSLLGEEWAKIVENPLAVVVQASLFVVLFAISMLPTIVRHIEQKKSASDHLNVDVAVKTIGDDEEEYDSERSTSAVLDMGVSSATRLLLLSQAGAVEEALERWRLMQPRSSPPSRSSKSRIDVISQNRGGAGVLFRRVAYEASVVSLLCLPIALYILITPSSSIDASERWTTGARLVSLLLMAFSLSRRVLSSIADEFKLTSSVDSFLQLLTGTVNEMTKSNVAPQADLQLAAQASADKGITVSDFWAAHAQRRAWACRGAQLSCRNGEVCLVLGDDGSGRSRLLTALAETLVAPPSKSRSTVFVRGQINVGGVDVTRWDKKRLKRNLALVLNDVRALSDSAELFSGLTLQEILDPASGGGGGPGSPSHNAMAIAMQVTGLSSVVARLPSKLSTVVTANEDELAPSPIRPSAQILSPSEWSKVLLTRSIAQAVLGNDNPMTSPDAVQRSLVGSLLLLDDVTAHTNEVEEAALIKALRATGAATLLASNHWASGRHANKIVVMKDGAVVESGTHAELMQRGPANSLYALRWKQMTSGV